MDLLGEYMNRNVMQQSKHKILSNENIPESATGYIDTEKNYIQISNLNNRKQLEVCIDIMNEPDIHLNILGNERLNDYSVGINNFISVMGYNRFDMNINIRKSDRPTNYSIRAKYKE